MQLDKTEIHLWFADIVDFPLRELEKNCLHWLSIQEQSRFNRFKRDKSRHEFLLGQFLIRSVLSEYGNRSAESWNFDLGPNGKPALDAQDGNLPLYFNLTHSRGRAVLAISRYEALGLDLESEGKKRRIREIAQRHFSPAEVEQLISLPQASQQSRFYELWTLKESYIKATGLGLSLSLSSFGFEIEQGALKFWLQSDGEGEAHDWQFWQLDCTADFRLALACRTRHEVAVSAIRKFRRTDPDQFEEFEMEILRSC